MLSDAGCWSTGPAENTPVVAQWTANVLLAVGAAPAMVDNPHEAGPFAGIAGGVLINLGTPYDDTAVAMSAAVASARASGTPWVLDPVAAGAAAWRTDVALTLLESAPPRIIRGNASEILALAGGTGGKGVDSVDSPEVALEVGEAGVGLGHDEDALVTGCRELLGRRLGQVGDRVVRIANGHPVMTRVTGVGCALGALMAAFAAVLDDGLLAATAATAVLTVAADQAVLIAQRPGSFAVALLDELDALTPESLAEKIRFGHK